MKDIIQEISKCQICVSNLEHGVNPVFSASPSCKIVIIGQAPGAIVHRTGIPWNDKSGIKLREWMGIGDESFYDDTKISIMPMGFCYPGKGKSGDLPPRKECAPQWHKTLLDQMKNVELILLIGKYAQDYYLKENAKRTLTETVRNYEDYLPRYFVLPHPSPRNNIWFKRNDWFGKWVVPQLKETIRRLL